MTRGALTLVEAASSATTTGALLAMAGTLLSALIAGGFGLWQLRRGHRFQRELEKQRWEFDIQRMELESQIEAERRLRDEELLASEQRQRAEAELQARLAEEEADADELRRRAVAYRRAVIAELRNLKILDMTRPLDLEALYVQVQVREEEPVRYVSEAEATRLAKGPPHSLLTERARPQTPVDDLDAAISLAPEEALRRYHRVALLGDPGAGKTTLLRHLTFRIARGEVTGGLTLPVYVELRRFADSDTSDLVDYVAAEWRDRHGFDGARPYLERELQAGRCALLLDGLDEVLGGVTADEAEAAHRRVSAEIDRLASRFPIAPIAVTCRRAGWRGKLPAFHTFEVLDFTWRQVQVFVDKWFERAPARAEGLRRALTANLRMQTLAANPLLLSLIAIVYERNLELPERRAELYRRCVEVLLREWDSHREIRRYSEFTTDRKRDLLEEVAWHFHRRGLRYFPEDELLSVVRRFLPTIDIDPRHAPAILDEIAAQYGLLKVQAHGWYGFLHLSLQEYFTAVAASVRTTAATAEIVRQRHDPWWEEVLLLLVGRANDASPLLLGILGRSADDGEPPTHEPLAVDDDTLHGDLLLAARCLANTPKIRTPWLRSRIVEATQRLLLNPPDHVTRRRVARALAEMRSRSVTDELFALVERDHETASAVCRAFGQVGDADTATRLLEILERRTIHDSTAIARALGELRHRPATPALLRLLDSDAEVTERGAVSVVRALGALGDRTALPTVFRLLRTSNGSSPALFDACAEALATLGMTSTAHDLMSALRQQEIAVTETLVQTMTALGGAPLAPPLLECLLDADRSRSGKPVIAAALAELPHPEVARVAVDALGERHRPWWLRYLLTEVLAGSRAEAECTLVAQVAAETDDRRVRLGAAATLATWQRRDGVPLLQTFLLDDTSWRTPDSDRRAGVDARHLWRRAASALHSLGDESVVPSLVERFKLWWDHERQGEGRPPPWFAAVEVYRPVAVGQRILELLMATEEWAFPSKRSLWALRYLEKVLTPPLLPDAIALVEKVAKKVDLTGQPWSSLLRTIATLASDAESVQWLQRLVRLTDANREAVVALDMACRRGGLRAFPDARVASVRNA